LLLAPNLMAARRLFLQLMQTVGTRSSPAACRPGGSDLLEKIVE